MEAIRPAIKPWVSRDLTIKSQLYSLATVQKLELSCWTVELIQFARCFQVARFPEVLANARQHLISFSNLLFVSPETKYC